MPSISGLNQKPAAVSCGENIPAESDDTSVADTTAAEETTSPEETKIPSGLPETMDLEGYTVNFYGKKEVGIWTEEETGDNVNDAVYARNRALNEKYNFEIMHIMPQNQSSPTNDIKASVQAGDDAWQVFVDGPGNSLKNYVTSALLYDMNTLKYQDFSQPWWFEELNNSLSLAGKLFMTCSSFSLTARQWLYNPIVNIDILENNGLKMKDYYQMVYDGKWTLDEFLKLCKVGSADLNGDGVRDKEDRFAHNGEDYAGYALAVGSGYMIARKDKDDIPYITAADEQSIHLWDKLVNETFSDTTNYLCIRNIKNVDSIWSAANNMMKKGQIMIQITTLNSSWRNYDIKYGILPMPKYNEEQERYYHTGSALNIPMLAVPITVTKPDEISFVLEAMAYESYYDVLPIFYEEYLETKLVRDRESIDMIRITHESLVLDPGAAYGWGSYLGELYKVVNRGQNTLVTFDASKRAVAEKAIADMMEIVKRTK